MIKAKVWSLFWAFLTKREKNYPKKTKNSFFLPRWAGRAVQVISVKLNPLWRLSMPSRGYVWSAGRSERLVSQFSISDKDRTVLKSSTKTLLFLKMKFSDIYLILLWPLFNKFSYYSNIIVTTMTIYSLNKIFKIFFPFKVWRHNLHEEMLAICQLVAQYPFVAMDTEFPGTLSPFSSFSIVASFDILMIKGVVIYPTNSCENEDYGYQLVKPQIRLFNPIKYKIE